MKLLTRYSVNTLLIILLMCPAASAATNQCVEFGTDAPVDCVDTSGGAVEGTAVLSTGEGGGTKFLREDGDGTSSWQTPAGAGDFLADGTVPMTGALQTSHGSILADATASGILTLGGVGGTNNENLTLDFETTINRAIIGTGTAVNLILWNISQRFQDDQQFQFGATSNSAFQWETTGNDNFQIGTNVGSVDGSGYISIMESSDLGNANRSPDADWVNGATPADPTFCVTSSDATNKLDQMCMWHDQTDANIEVGGGELLISADNVIFEDGGFVGFGNADPGTNLSISAAAGVNTIFQITNETLGTTSGNGFEIFITDAGGGGIINRESGSMELRSGGTIVINSNGGALALNSSTGFFSLKDNGNNSGLLVSDNANTQFMIAPYDNAGNQVIITNSANLSKAHGIAVQINPTFVIQSDLDPTGAGAGQQLWIWHDQTDSNIESKFGDLKLTAAGGDIQLGDDNLITTGKVQAATYGSDGSVTDAELKYINTLSSNAQTQIDAKGAHAGQVWTGEHDFGGGGIEIENNTAIPGACTVGQVFLDTDGTTGEQFYACESGSFVKQGGSGAAGANTALSNLAAVQINTTLFSDTADTDSLGTTGAEWLNLYLGDAGKFYMGLGQDVSLNRSSANTLTIVATTLIDMSSTTGALTLPTGVIGSRPSPSYGMVRADSGLGHIEWYDGSAWKSILDGDDDVADSGVCSLTVAASDADSANADYTCNGTNDEVQINAAIDALPATGGTVCLTDGTFVLEPSTQIGATDDYWAIKLDVDNTSLLGAGMSTVLQLEDTWTAGASDVGYLVYSTGLSNLKIQNIAFDGNLGNNGTGGGSGIWLDQTLESTISGNYIHDFDQEGIRGTTLSESLITDNVIENIGGENNVGYAIHIDVESASPDDSVRTVISNNRIWGDNTGGSPWGAQDGIIVGSTSSGGFGITVEGNSVYGYLDGIMMHASKSNIIGNNVQSQTWRGIVIGTNANYVNVTGNVVQDQNWSGIDVFGDYVLLSGNTIFDVGEANAYSSIFIESGADEALVVGNVIVDTAGSGYAINVSNSSCDNTVLSWNKYSGTGATSINDVGTNTQIFDDVVVEITNLIASFGSTGLVVKTGNLIPKHETIDPCSAENEGSLHWNSTNNYLCVCIAGNSEQVSDGTTDCAF